MARTNKDFEDIAYTVNISNAEIQAVDKFVEDNKDNILPANMTRDECINAGYRPENHRGLQGWFFHPALPKLINLYTLSRYAMLINMRNARDKKDGISISCFMFSTDKAELLKTRNMPTNTVDRFDQFICTDDGLGNFRKNGTIEGNLMSKNQKRKFARDSNREFVHILAYGDYDPLRNLTCPYSGVVVENIRIRNSLTGKISYENEYQHHHPKFSGRTSQGKSGSPSEAMNKFLIGHLPHESIIEFLNLIPLSASRHTSLHKASSCEDITCWFDRLKHGEVEYLPFHWLSEEKYELTLDKLSLICKNLRRDKVLSYKEFIEYNTLSTNEGRLLELERKSNISSNLSFLALFDFSGKDVSQDQYSLV